MNNQDDWWGESGNRNINEDWFPQEDARSPSGSGDWFPCEDDHLQSKSEDWPLGDDWHVKQDSPRLQDKARKKSTNRVKPLNNRTQQTLSPEKGVFIGIAQEVHSSPSNERTFLSAWLDSLIYGMPFSRSKIRNVFNLQLQEVQDTISISSQRSVAVTFYGDTSAGLISRGQTIHVNGHFGPDRTVYAKKIVNLTNGSIIRIDRAIPAWLVRFITLVIMLLLVWFVLGLVNGIRLPHVNGLFSGINWQDLAITIVFALLGLWWVVNLLRHPSRWMIRLVGIILLCLFCYLVPSAITPIGTIVIMCIGIYIMFQSLR